MSITHASDIPALTTTQAAAVPQKVVAVILEHHGRIALFKRSQTVRHDQNLWHCVTGYLEPGTSPGQQALMELHEETGLGPMDLCCLESPPHRPHRQPMARGHIQGSHLPAPASPQRRTCFIPLDAPCQGQPLQQPRRLARSRDRLNPQIRSTPRERKHHGTGPSEKQ